MKQRTNYFEGWKMYRWCCLGHHLQGAIVALAVIFGGVSEMVMASVWTVLYVAYQGLSVIRKKDSAGLDVSDFMAGAAIVALIYGLTILA